VLRETAALARRGRSIHERTGRKVRRIGEQLLGQSFAAEEHARSEKEERRINRGVS